MSCTFYRLVNTFLCILALASVVAAQIPVPNGAQPFTNTGPFTNTTTLAVGAASRPTAVLQVDLNADGMPDLVTANFSVGTVEIRLAVVAGISYGPAQSFLPYTTLPNSNLAVPVALAAADFDGDGNVDIAVRCNGLFAAGVPSGIGYVQNLGGGSFGIRAPVLAPLFGASYGPSSMVATDFDGDGFADLALATSSGVLLVTNPSGTVPNVQTLATVSSTANPNYVPIALSLAAIVNPNAIDLYTVGFDSSAPNVQLAVPCFFLFGTINQVGGFTLSGSFAQSVASTDIDGDGDTDAAILSLNSVEYLINGIVPTGGSLFLSTQATPVLSGGFNIDRMILPIRLSAEAIPALLINNDGGTYSILRSLGATHVLEGTYANPSGVGGSAAIATADLNGDGMGDLTLAERFADTISMTVHSTNLQSWSSVNGSSCLAGGGSLSVTPLTIGAPASVSLVGAFPNSPVALIYSGSFATTRIFALPPLFCLSHLFQPAVFNSTTPLSTDATGALTVNLGVVNAPPAAAGFQFGFEAVVVPLTPSGAIPGISNLAIGAIGF